MPTLITSDVSQTIPTWNTGGNEWVVSSTTSASYAGESGAVVIYPVLWIVEGFSNKERRRLAGTLQLGLWGGAQRAGDPAESARREAARQAARCSAFARSDSKRATVTALVQVTTRLRSAQISVGDVYKFTRGYGQADLTEFQRLLATAYFDHLSWDDRVLLEEWLVAAFRAYEAGVSEHLIARILRRLTACLQLSHLSGRPVISEHVARVLREMRFVIVPIGPPAVAAVGS
jgi:hypothetical protein